MKNFLIFLLFMPLFLFAEEPGPENPEEDRESVFPVSNFQVLPFTQEEITGAHVIFNGVLGEMREGRWREERVPGPIFNTCSTWGGAVQCVWTIFRMDNLTRGHFREAAYLINNHITTERLEQELSYIQAFPESVTPLEKAWFLFLTVEFTFWALQEGLSDPHRLVPMANTFAYELLLFIQENPISTLKGPQRAFFPFVLYALYSYVSLSNTLFKGELTEPLQELSDLIKAYFFHRNDNGPIDQTVKTRACSIMKRAGIHRDYLEGKNLLLPGYEEFEKRTAQEDIQRIKDCETEHETITFSGGGPGEPKDVISSLYYANVLLLLKATGGNEAVRYFIRHNPVFHREFALPKEMLNKNSPGHNVILMGNRRIAFSILAEIFEDPEWQVTWQSIGNDHSKAFLSGASTLESAIFSIFALSEPHLLNRHNYIVSKK